MNNSIQHFCQEGIVKLEKIMTDYANDPTKIAEMVYSVTDMVTKLGTDIIAEEWEKFDEIIRKSPERKKQGWYVKDKVETNLITSLGQVTYHKTLYHNKNTGEYEYLLDRAMGINPHERITEDAAARILEEVVETSYRKGGANANIRKYIERSKFVLDKFYMHKYIIAATSHLKESAEDARSDIYRAIHKKCKWLAEGVFDKIIEVTESESKQRAVEASKKYILGNWPGIMEQISNKSAKNECSAEGHISHIYADRMSSRPLGWSEVGVDKMSRLRVYHFNKGSMLELVRQQKKELPMAAGAEEVVLSCAEIYKSEREAKANAGKYADIPVYSVTKNIRKVLAIRHHLWDL